MRSLYRIRRRTDQASGRVGQTFILLERGWHNSSKTGRYHGRTNQLPIEPGRVYAQAIEALNRHQWAAAHTLAASILPITPRQGGVHFVAGVAALHLQQVGEALRLLRLATQLNPSRADYAAQFARALAAARLMREALNEANRAAAMPLQEPLTMDTLAVAFIQATEHARAANLFRRVVALRPDVASFRFNLATSLTLAGIWTVPRPNTKPV